MNYTWLKLLYEEGKTFIDTKMTLISGKTLKVFCLDRHVNRHPNREIRAKETEKRRTNNDKKSTF